MLVIGVRCECDIYKVKLRFKSNFLRKLSLIHKNGV